MTTEIAIMNRQGIALAADSAVTVGRQRVWKTTNKLFSLSPFNDIAIMAYGSGEFIGFPWETVIKSYRLHVGPRKFQTVKECASDFIDYIRSTRFSRDEEEKLSVLVLFERELKRIAKALVKSEKKMEFRADLGNYSPPV